MTGLDVDRHVIVEIAALVTDDELEPLDDGIDLVVHQPPARARARWTTSCGRCTRSRPCCRRSRRRRVTLADAGAQALEYVRGHVPEAATAPLCGNSIGVDRRFLDQLAPRARPLPALPQHRRVELKELCRRWYPDVYRSGRAKAETHRALADINESIAELRYYREHMLRAAARERTTPV